MILEHPLTIGIIVIWIIYFIQSVYWFGTNDQDWEWWKNKKFFARNALNEENEYRQNLVKIYRKKAILLGFVIPLLSWILIWYEFA